MSKQEIENYIEQWNTIRSKTIRREVILMILIALLTLIGLVFDIIFCCDNYEWLRNISQIVLQIQGTVTTLSLTVITLINGYINKSLYGISITDFYMNIKPWVLTQRRVIVIILAELILSILLYFIGLYCLIISVYISGILLILYVSLMMYSAFKGRRETDKHILQYVLYFFDSDCEISYKTHLLENFEQDWRELVEMQSKIEADKYKEIYRYCCRKIIESAEEKRHDKRGKHDTN